MLEYLVQNKEAKRALAILRRPDVSQELFYKFAPGLMALAPGNTVRFVNSIHADRALCAGF